MTSGKKPEIRTKKGSLPYLRLTGENTQLIVDGKPFVMLAGEVHNSSSSNLEYLKGVWERTALLNCNTVIAPVYWELVEPAEGRYDWKLVDGMIAESRKRNLKLVPLWFGTWKNASSDYCPEWVKTDPNRFPRAETEPGKRVNSVSALSEEAVRADSRAFAAFMRRLKVLDRRKHTAIAVQVENETGLLGAPRDRSPLAEQAFSGPIPVELTRRLQSGVKLVRAELESAWKEAGARIHGTWAEVFGTIANEAFMAWHVARYVGRVAEAGKREYPLPAYANAWLVWEGYQKPGDYPSGGPVSRMLDIWRAAAPSIECLAPDIYSADFAGVCADYDCGGNPLLIPEARKGQEAPANAFYSIAEHDAICFAPFGIEDVHPDGPLARTYALLSEIMPLVTEFQGTGRMRGILKRKPVTEEETQELNLGGWTLRVGFPARQEGSSVPGGLVIASGPGEFIAAGSGFRIDFLSREKGDHKADFLSIEEGVLRNGRWVPGRRLNGDERHVALAGWLSRDPAIVRARIYSY